jgi:hypothetical protein
VRGLTIEHLFTGKNAWLGMARLGCEVGGDIIVFKQLLISTIREVF